MKRYDGHFRLAHELGKHLHEIMGWPGPMTHRQYEAWQAWLAEQWNHPSRTDYYLMQAAAEIVRTPGRIWGKLPRVTLDNMRIPFVAARPFKPYVRKPGGPPGALTKEEVVKFRVLMRTAQIKAAGVKK